MIMVMFMVNIAEAKAKLSEYLDAVGRGERVVICRHNRPVAELRAVASGTATRRRLGAAAGIVDIPASFFAPLPDPDLDAFEGELREAKTSVTVAKGKSTYRVSRTRRRR
jgi:prevent-host-death family protein